MAKTIRHKLLDWHHWPFTLFHLPVIPVWIFYYVKSRSLWFMSSSNPELSLGGFEGEAKTEMYAQLPPHLFPVTVVVQPRSLFTYVTSLLNRSSIRFPCIVKPNVGAKGILFRKIENEQQLHAYHKRMPATYLIQEYLEQSFEVSVFYIRMPAAASGKITAIIKKILPEITGNGISTIEQLMEAHPGACDQLNKLKHLHKQHLKKILPAGETLLLSEIANLYNGARFTNLTTHANGKMLKAFDDISHRSKFYYGRYDIRCSNLNDLENGNFKILEFNGAGSVANHIFTETYSLLQGYKEILRHWKALYQISRYNHTNGYPHWHFLQGLKFFWQVKKHFNQLKRIDKQLVLPAAKNNLQPADIENIYGRVE